MINYEATTNKLARYSEKVLLNLSGLDVDNFERNFNIAVKYMKRIKELKQEVGFDSSPDTFGEYREKVDFLAKQISEKYDNIVKKYEDEVSQAGEELRTTRTQKKILLYTRGR